MQPELPPSRRTPVVLVHGMWSNRHTWGDTAAHLQAQGYEVLDYELPEHGLRYRDPKQLGRLGLQDYVADLVAWVSTQPARPILIGHSMGGLIALQAAAQLHQRGLDVPGVIAVTPAIPSGAWAISWSNFRVFLRPCLTQMMGRRAFSLTASEARFGLYHDTPTPQHEAKIRALQAESGRALMQVAWWFLDLTQASKVRWQDVTCPVRIYLGGRDRIVPSWAGHVFRQLRQGDVHIHPQSSHMVFDDMARSHFFEWLRQTLSEIAP